MKKLVSLIFVTLIFSCSSKENFSPQKTDLVSKWDTLRPLINPDKGWYHHMLDNGIERYLIQDEKDLTTFVGMDHLYLRLAWAYLEPEEGKYNWSYIDSIVEKYVPMGYKISFRITCKETGGAPGSVPVEVDGIRYATPYWVIEAGASGIDRPEYGSASWTPDWDDPIYLGKLDNFHKAFAKKYDGKPWVRYIDVGSIGEWGEGHTYYSTRIPATNDEIKTHLNLYLKHYKNALLVVSDDLLRFGKSEEEMEELLNFAKEKGFSFRDDSPMVDVEDNLDTWTVSQPHFFEAVYKTRPTVFELQHYAQVKKDGHWMGQNGSTIIPGVKVSGAEIFRNAMELIHPTYIGFHGYLGEWLADNPELTVELFNRSGYWYFPQSIQTTDYVDGELSFEITWLNKGVAPAYSGYQLKGKLIPEDNSDETIEFVIQDSGNKDWMPNQITTEKYKVALPVDPRGNYQLAIQLFDEDSGGPVEIGLTTNIKHNDCFVIQNLSF
ncbi:beta-galactosidase [Maribacter sp. ANRC-HE7]|uniref:Beta-galactosidase n=1 Tax=Maribacter aquimaris TaxID=2737171 RepID=A0ABR7V2P8_9FLAO|nr:beta-galactosidase [Maribacter aquimaris]MBD0777576.1 beta-galactosidase [Maribacter aquimaris]